MQKELWLVWKNPIDGKYYKIGILTNDEKGYEFRYARRELKDAKLAGFDYFPGFDDTEKVYRDSRLFVNIATRLPNIKRPDYLEILNTYNLEKTSTDFDILKATKGKLVTDSYEFVPAFDLNKIEFDIEGTGKCKDVELCQEYLEINNKLYLEVDNSTIKVLYFYENKKYHIGYIPQYYSEEILKVLNNDVNYSAMIQGLNFETRLLDGEITITIKLIFDVLN